ncbi:uncharacterized protein V6R79_000650 [Siganus canaliculatus]
MRPGTSVTHIHRNKLQPDLTGPKRTDQDKVWTTLDQSGPVWTTLDHSGPGWTTLDQAGPASTGLMFAFFKTPTWSSRSRTQFFIPTVQTSRTVKGPVLETGPELGPGPNMDT